MTTARLRYPAWLVLVALAVFDAYTHRYTVSPDGISYLDLSDAVVSGNLAGLVNLYWSPLYPFLVGLARLVIGSGPQVEIVAMHVLNVLLFGVALAAFEYFLIAIRALAARRPGTPLAGPWGDAAAYFFFGTHFLPMVPPELTTPDLLSNAAIFVALGAMLRLHDATHPHRGRASVALGAALGIGALAKSFLVPWGVVCLVMAGLSARQRRLAAPWRAIVLWLAIVLPWTFVLSARAGRFTFGDAGRLTFGWYVNQQDAPSAGGVPPGARLAEAQRILPGTGVTGPAPGTDPMWFDPARWNADIHPRFSLSDQLPRLGIMTVTFIGNIVLLTFLALYVFIAPRRVRREALREVWVVILPCIAGILAYALVITAARYIAAFVIAGVLVTLAAIPVTRRAKPGAVLAGLVASLLPLATDPQWTVPVSLGASVVAAMIVGVVLRIDRRPMWLVAVPLAGIVAALNLPPNLPATATAASVLFVLALWRLAVAAVRRGETRRFALSMQAALAMSVALFSLSRLVPRLMEDVQAMRAARNGSTELRVAEELRSLGVMPGTRIALIGPHAESYWVRAARLNIVANVPPPVADAWWTTLTTDRRGAALRLFAEHGARVAIATPPVPPAALDSGWLPLRTGGWARALPLPPSR
jgi:hypothetical protein